MRNLTDGRVEGVFEGDRTQINSILDWCHQGPSSSVVKDVTIEYEEPEGLENFIIKR
ncbi:MAG TPA: acylphosphatase [Allocoleopsis sp.]